MNFHIVDVMRNRLTKKFSIAIKHNVAKADSVKTVPNKFGFMYFPETMSDKTAVNKLIKFMLKELEDEKKVCDHIIDELTDVKQRWLIEESKKRRGVKS